jgi:hypothetical protein
MMYREHISRCMPLLAAAFAAGACNLVDGAVQHEATMSRMLPGRLGAGGRLDCWLTIEFERYPDGVDPHDVRVRFYSPALAEPAEFDWRYIAGNDVVARAAAHGGAPVPQDRTRPGEPPPLGEAIDIRFPLTTRPALASLRTPIRLQAELYWGGKSQGALQHDIEDLFEELADTGAH